MHHFTLAQFDLSPACFYCPPPRVAALGAPVFAPGTTLSSFIAWLWMLLLSPLHGLNRRPIACACSCRLTAVELIGQMGLGRNVLVAGCGSHKAIRLIERGAQRAVHCFIRHNSLFKCDHAPQSASCARAVADAFASTLRMVRSSAYQRAQRHGRVCRRSGAPTPLFAFALLHLSPVKGGLGQRISGHEFQQTLFISLLNLLTMKPQNGTQSIDKALIILALITSAKHDLYPNVAAISAATGFNRSTVHRILAALQRHNFVVRDSSGIFRPGPHLIPGTYHRLCTLAGPLLLRLSAITKETCLLHVRSADYTICIYQAEAPHPLRVTYSVGSTSPLHTGCSGRVILTFSPPSLIEHYLSAESLPIITPQTLVDKSALRRLIEHDRERGYVTSHGEREPLVSGLGVPVWNPDKTLNSGITILWPDARSDTIDFQMFLHSAIETADAITEQLTAASSIASTF